MLHARASASLCTTTREHRRCLFEKRKNGGCKERVQKTRVYYMCVCIHYRNQESLVQTHRVRAISIFRRARSPMGTRLKIDIASPSERIFYVLKFENVRRQWTPSRCDITCRVIAAMDAHRVCACIRNAIDDGATHTFLSKTLGDSIYLAYRTGSRS